MAPTSHGRYRPPFVYPLLRWRARAWLLPWAPANLGAVPLSGRAAWRRVVAEPLAKAECQLPSLDTCCPATLRFPGVPQAPDAVSIPVLRFPGRLVSFPLRSPVPTHLLGLHSAAASSRKPSDPMTFLKGVLRRRSDSGPERRPERGRLRPAAPGCTRHALPARPADREGLEGRAVPSSPFRPPRPHT